MHSSSTLPWGSLAGQERLVTIDRVLWMLSECRRHQSDWKTFNNCIYLLYWSHYQHFSNENKTVFTSYISPTVANKQHKHHTAIFADHQCCSTVVQALCVHSSWYCHDVTLFNSQCHGNLPIVTRCYFTQWTSDYSILSLGHSYICKYGGIGRLLQALSW